MKIAVIGATGTTGQQFVEQALAKGHTVTVLVRSRQKLTMESPQLKVIVGNVLNHEDVCRAVAGQDAIFIALGTGKFPKKSTIRTEGTRQVVNALTTLGENPWVVVLSSLGVGDSQQQMPFYWRWMLNVILRYAFADHQQQENIIKASGLRWVILRPTFMKNQPSQGTVKATPAPQKVKVGHSLAFAQTALFALNTLEQKIHRGEAVTLTL